MPSLHLGQEKPTRDLCEKPTPDDSGVGYKLYSTVPPWLRPEPPLIAAITGGPVPAYCAGVQPGSSEGVSHGAGAEEAFTKRLPLWPSYPRPVFVTASLPCPLYHKLRPVSRSGQKVAIRRRGYCAEYVNPAGSCPPGDFSGLPAGIAALSLIQGILPAQCRHGFQHRLAGTGKVPGGLANAVGNGGHILLL